MVETISQGTVQARKPHQCFHCYRQIGYGERYEFQVNKYDGAIYTLRWHLDCEQCANEFYAADLYYDDSGFPSLRDELLNSGVYQEELNYLRGFYPHVVARMELTDQLFCQL